MNLEKLSDKEIVMEAYNRLKSRHEAKEGKELRFGTFKFVVHCGVLVSIELQRKDKFFKEEGN